jgi:uncharacterized protein
MTKDTHHMIEMVVNKIKVDENRSEQIIVLKEREGSKLLPVVIGMSEVNAIKLKLSGVTPPRPLTHDLLYNMIAEFGAKMKWVIIDKLEANTFFAKLVLQTSEGKEIAVDARPSDSIALALRADCPIFIENNILEQAGIQP